MSRACARAVVAEQLLDARARGRQLDARRFRQQRRLAAQHVRDGARERDAGERDVTAAAAAALDGMKISAAALIAALAIATGCGDDETRTAAPPAATATPTATPTDAEPTAARSERKGTSITLRGSEFGTMLFDSRRQAIYIFERDSRNRSVCYGECADAWPPVLTKGRPRAGKGVDQDLLGTVRRRGGARQVTYAGRPLYFYAHEGPGQVLCHNVDLNGGLWWVVGPDGRRRA